MSPRRRSRGFASGGSGGSGGSGAQIDSPPGDCLDLLDSSARLTVEITFQVPDSVADRLRVSWKDLPRHALEAMAADAYRQGLLTSADVQEVLGISSRYELDGFLKQAGAFLQYTAQDLEDDVRSFLAKTSG